jgi:hypothetical protein
MNCTFLLGARAFTSLHFYDLLDLRSVSGLLESEGGVSLCHSDNLNLDPDFCWRHESHNPFGHLGGGSAAQPVKVEV